MVDTMDLCNYCRCHTEVQWPIEHLLVGIPKFTLEKSSEASWKCWLYTFKCQTLDLFQYLPDSRKVGCLARNLLPSFMPVFVAIDLDLERSTYEEVVSSLTKYFQGINTRMTLLRRVQRQGETFEEFAEHLIALSMPCRFHEPLRLQLVRDIFVNNLHSNYSSIKEKLSLQDISTSLEYCIAMANKLVDGANSYLCGGGSTEARELPTLDDSIRAPQVNVICFRPGEIVEVDIVGSNGNLFFVWPSALRDNRQKFLSSLQREVNRESQKKTVASNIAANDKLVARVDGVWYRVIVLDKIQDFFKVRSIDFGWLNSIPQSDFRFIPQNCIEAHPLATSVQTSDPLTVGQLSCLLEFVHVKNGVWSVTLVAPANRTTEPTENELDPELQTEPASSVVSVPDTSDSLKPPFPIGKTGYVKVTFVAPVGIVYVCKENDWATLQRINHVLSKAIRFPMGVAHNDSLCAYEFEGIWCRVRIISIDREKGVAHLLFMDWGNEEWVKLSDLFVLPDELVEILPLSFPIVVSSPQSVAEADTLEIRIKKKDESGAWIVELIDIEADNSTKNQKSFGQVFNKDSTVDVQGNREQDQTPKATNPVVVRNVERIKTENGFEPMRRDSEASPSFEARGVVNGILSHNPSENRSVPSDKGKASVRFSPVITTHSYKKVRENKVLPRDNKETSGRPSKQPAVPNESLTRRLETPALPRVKEEPLEETYQPPPIPEDEFTPVRIVYVGCEGKFATPVGVLETVRKQLDEICIAASAGEPGHPLVGNYVAAPFEGLMYRAKIISTDPRHSSARVSFVDFGNESDVPFSELVAIPVNLTKNIYNFKFELAAASDTPLEEGQEMSVKPITLQSDGSWLLEVQP